MSKGQGGKLAGSSSRIKFGEPKDEVEAIGMHYAQKNVAYWDKQEKKEAKKVSKARAKITLPKFSWDKEKEDETGKV